MTYDAVKYTDRLSALRFFPVKAQAVAAIAELLMGICPTEAEVDQLVTIALRRYSEWPGPGKVRELHESEIASKRPRQAQPEGCDLCRNLSGFKRVLQVVGPEREIENYYPGPGEEYQVEQELWKRYRGSKTHNVYAAITPCSCALGMLRKEECRKFTSQRQS